MGFTALGERQSGPEAYRVAVIVSSVLAIILAAPAIYFARREIWVGVAVVALDASIYALMLMFSRRYWIGFLFVAPWFFLIVNVLAWLSPFVQQIDVASST